MRGMLKTLSFNIKCINISYYRIPILEVYKFCTETTENR